MTNKTTPSMASLWETSFLDGNNAAFVDQLYEQYLADPSSVDETWQAFFADLLQGQQEESHQAVREYFESYRPTAHEAAPVSLEQTKVGQLINAYRSYGHHHAHLDPLGLAERKKIKSLSLEHYGLAGCLDKAFDAGDFRGLQGKHTLKTIVKALEQTYCSSVGVEYSHLTNGDEIDWLNEQFESNQMMLDLSEQQKKKILQRLTAAEGMEKYLGRKFVGQKRFSLEGGDSLIPLLTYLIHHSAKDFKMSEVVMGMAHRGRLNVLVNVLGKAPETLFEEFEGKYLDVDYSGDVKYHKGFSSDIEIEGNKLHLSLAFNPSHLEIVSPVVEGAVRARQRRLADKARNKVLPLVMHGDAAFAGQGVVMETFAMSQARGYTTGGSVHVVINNQIGFTTNNPLDARSTLYCTDIAKMVQAPILHVNADDPEAVWLVANIALQYRMKFNKDVVIDLVCYRRHGHNESDEPSATQPVMYQNIKTHPTTRKLYAEKLLREKVIEPGFDASLMKEYNAALDRGQPVAEARYDLPHYEFGADWTPFKDKGWRESYKSNISVTSLKKLGKLLTHIPAEVKLQPQVKKVMGDRANMLAGKQPLDWGAAENLAYATLLNAGIPVRISGQDCGRGTFSHRHANVYNQVDNAVYTPLAHVNKDTSFLVIDSILSEEAVLAFEYGFTSCVPDNLVVWEAQFGDFANGAQVVIDQFISSGEQKWMRLCGLVMLLPHGYEGMGPEHSSARLERFLQLCAQENMQVCVPSTPAQIYHLLRRQMLRPFRKPLIVMTPKSILRHKLAVSPLEDLANGSFENVIPEIDDINTSKIKRIVLCSGKIYYELLTTRREQGMDDVAIIRLEQLYPFPYDEIKAELKKYPKASELVWCQEEPKNQGAWTETSGRLLQKVLPDFPKLSLRYAGRKASASPATGLPKVHLQEQAELVLDALNLNND